MIELNTMGYQLLIYSSFEARIRGDMPKKKTYKSMDFKTSICNIKLKQRNNNIRDKISSCNTSSTNLHGSLGSIAPIVNFR